MNVKGISEKPAVAELEAADEPEPPLLLAVIEENSTFFWSDARDSWSIRAGTSWLVGTALPRLTTEV
jgi:hypothetical protein